jgi:hypothetical protein
MSSRLHSVTPQNTVIFTVTNVRTSDLIKLITGRTQTVLVRSVSVVDTRLNTEHYLIYTCFTSGVRNCVCALSGLGYIEVTWTARPEKPNAWGYNWATLFLGEIITGTWPSSLGESQK